MKIIILGANHVAISLAENLSSEANDITMVDPDGERLRDLKDRIDIGTAVGQPSYPDVLRMAGADDADMLVALTEDDQINLVACQIAHVLFKTPKKICRLRSASYMQTEALFQPGGIAADVVISPEQLVSLHVERLIDQPGSLQVLDFAGGRVQLVAVKAYYGGMLVGQEIRFLSEHMPNVKARVAAIFRRDRPVMPEGSTVIEADDEVFFIADKNHIRDVMDELRRADKPYRRIIIAGGGNIGSRLAAALETRYQLKIIERSPQRCAYLSEHLSRAIILNGESSDRELLLEESIEDTDVLEAPTKDDEATSAAPRPATRMGASRMMSLSHRAAYVELLQRSDIDIAVSPQQVTIGSLLTHVRRGDVAAVHSLRRGAAEALEAIAHGDPQSSKVVGRRIGEIELPKGTTIGAVIRGEEVLMPHDTEVVQSGDHLILFLVDKKRIPEVERLFQVGLTFF